MNIYGLFDPRSPDVIMYVGKGLSYRAAHHWLEFLNRGTAENRRELRWLKKLKTEGVKPSWKFLEENVENWQRRERYWIAYWREKNLNLCNVLDGGNELAPDFSSLGGRTANRIHPGLAKRAGHLGGLTANKIHPNLAKRAGHLGGSISGPLHAKNKTGVCGQSPEKMFKNGCKSGYLHAKNKTGVCGRLPEKMSDDGYRGMHIRWHVNRNKPNPECKFCQEAASGAH